MEREKLLRIQGKLKKYSTLLRYFSLLTLTFLFLQIEAFSVDITASSLLPKITLFAGILQLLLFLIFLRLEEGSLGASLTCLKQSILEKSTIKLSLCPIFLLLSTELLKLAGDWLPKEAKEANAFHIVGVLLFSIIVLRKKFMLTQILAITFIAFGLTNFSSITQASSTLSIFTVSSMSKENSICGYLLILAAICCYGVSFAILESTLKSSDVSLWVRGIQLNLFSVSVSLAVSTYYYYMNEQQDFFENFNIIAWFFIVFVAACNMMELFVIKIADSLFRMISFALATMIIGIMQTPIDTVNSHVKIGSGLILAGTFLYSTIDLAHPSGENKSQDLNERGSSSLKIYQSVPTVSYKLKEIN